LAVEFNSDTFEKHTQEQIDSDSLRKAVYARVFSGFKCFRIQSFYYFPRIQGFRIRPTTEMIFHRIRRCMCKRMYESDVCVNACMNLLYINDLSNVSNILELILFADDTNIFFSHHKFSSLVNTVNCEIDKISEWFKANKLSLNLKKSNYVIFKSRQKRIDIDLSLKINDHQITRAKEVVFLGIILDQHISWKPHISYVATKISKSVGVIYKASFFLSKSTLSKLYFSLVYPYLQYCITVWGSTYPTNLNRIILLQKRIIRILDK
jgi:hypothetical protein